MPIAHVRQPEFLPVGETLRLRRFCEPFDFALDWYQDAETLMLVDGSPTPYDMARLTRMYHILNARGELYWIEIRDGSVFRPIGDVTFWQEDMPIVIGDRRFRKMGIGRQVVSALIRRGKLLGYDHLAVREIYRHNHGSRRLFEGLGFRVWEDTPTGSRYRLELPTAGPVLRPYRSEDCSVLVTLFHDTVHQICRGDYTPAQLDAWAGGQVDLAAWDRSFLAHDTLVACKDGIIVGFADMDETGYLDRLYVHKDYQRQAVAKTLCSALEARNGGPDFTTHASRTARAFFIAQGYHVVRSQRVLRQGQLLTNFVMEKTAL